MTPYEEYRLIPLTNGQFTKVDSEDFDWLSEWHWKAHPDGNGGFRVARDFKLTKDGVKIRKTFLMHREIVQCPAGMVVDHINGDSLDNRRINLRTCKPQQNRFNSRKRKPSKYSRFKGVTPSGKAAWRATIMKDCKSIHIGTYRTQEGAARAYDAKAKELFGEFAHLNFTESLFST